MHPADSSASLQSVPVLAKAFVMVGVFSWCLSCQRQEQPARPSDASPSTQTSEPAEAASQEGEPPEGTVSPGADVAATSELPSTSPDGRELYVQHCAACHGEQGDGRGVAAAFLFPKPRNFASGSFRLVSTKNNVPTREDLHAVLLRGMPGSAMPPWEHLTQAQRDALIDEVMRLRQQGARQQYIALLKDLEGLTEKEIAEDDVQDDIRGFVSDRTTPGETTEVPEIPPSTDAALARGKQVYGKLCQACHGAEGKGDGTEEMFDEDKLPTSPRDFAAGIFKGGHDPESLYRRIAYGMPGTPMPATTQLTSEQMVDLVHYIRSLSTEQQREAAVLNRETVIASRLPGVPQTSDADAWSNAAPAHLRMTPLWWRHDVARDFTVQAVHDGTSLAVRLSWQDETQDLHATRSESFEDAVAMEIYRGGAEPFLGMGDPKSPIDVWFWDADRQSAPHSIEDEYPQMVADIYPFGETAVATAEYERTGTKMESQPELSLPALQSGNQIASTSPRSGASTLAGGGPGSVTFRIPKSQLVTAHGEWKDGRWTVVMHRTLAVETDEDGISLAPGQSASVAFAVWDGAQQDRDGKKLITIWQDLELEP